ncbi:hypothetical protein TNCT_572601 [Trichonephila clavata]|uniref:Uncharacterized protein n=1 Tax=Trichonephila clavata TaxID=2740835 RepID=A0A8X6K486_TRICU|nr:hypothetical protein TNCT_572601 [Trichonephila clavata]
METYTYYCKTPSNQFIRFKARYESILKVGLDQRIIPILKGSDHTFPKGPNATISFIDHRDQQSKRKRQQNVNLISSSDPQIGKDNN